MADSGYGGGGWGVWPWGDGDYAFALVEAHSWRENVIRLEFNQNVFYSGLFDTFDAGVASKYTITPVSESLGMDGEPARAVTVVKAQLVRDDPDVLPAGEGRFLDLTLDRPFTPFPALYTLHISGTVYSEDKSETIEDETAQIVAVYRELAKPIIDEATPSRDIANPQTLSMMEASLPRPSAALLATYSADDTGDYAFDQGMVSLRKRLYRRTFTRKNAFAHLPGYGLGIQEFTKKLGTSTVQSRLATDAEAQFLQEPEVAKCRVTFAPIPNKPGGWVMRTLIKTRQGVGQRFDFNVG